MPRISVIVPIYKVEPYLRKCVNSILSQSFRDFELILVDDGSPDHCGEICDEYAKTDERIRVIHQHNGGLSAARNAGLDIARGEWILFIDPDDWVDSGYFDALNSAAVRYEGWIVLSTVRKVYADGWTTTVGPVESITMSPSEIYSAYGLLAVWACGKLFRKDMIGDLRFPVGKIQEDEFFTYRVLFQCPKVAIVADVSYNYLQRSDSIVGAKWYHERILALDGMKEQREFFRNSELRTAFEAVTKRLFQWMIGAWNCIRIQCPEDRDGLARIRKEMDSLLADDESLRIVKSDFTLWHRIRCWRYPKFKMLWQVGYTIRLFRNRGIVETMRKLLGFAKYKIKMTMAVVGKCYSKGSHTAAMERKRNK